MRYFDIVRPRGGPIEDGGLRLGWRKTEVGGRERSIMVTANSGCTGLNGHRRHLEGGDLVELAPLAQQHPASTIAPESRPARTTC